MREEAAGRGRLESSTGVVAPGRVEIRESSVVPSQLPRLVRPGGMTRVLLRIDAGYRAAGSWSRRLTDSFVTRWRECHPGGRVIVRDTGREPVPPPDEATIAAFYGSGDRFAGPVPPEIALSDRLIGELRQADDIVVGSPLYNFSVPAGLKSWIDHIVRPGHTFAAGDRGPVGLLAGRRVFLITVRGGFQDRSPDYQTPALEAVFRYIGITDIRLVSLEGTQVADGHIEVRVRAAMEAVDGLLERRVPMSC